MQCLTSHLSSSPRLLSSSPTHDHSSLSLTATRARPRRSTMMNSALDAGGSSAVSLSPLPLSVSPSHAAHDRRTFLPHLHHDARHPPCLRPPRYFSLLPLPLRLRLHPLCGLPSSPLPSQRRRARRVALRHPRRFGRRQDDAAQLPRPPRRGWSLHRRCAHRRPCAGRLLLLRPLRLRPPAERPPTRTHPEGDHRLRVAHEAAVRHGRGRARGEHGADHRSAEPGPLRGQSGGG